MIVTTTGQLADFFKRSRNSVVYQIRLGRLPDPRVGEGVETEGLAWPELRSPGRPLGGKNRDSIRFRLDALEKRLSFLEEKLNPKP